MALSATNAINELIAGANPIKRFHKSITGSLVLTRHHSLWPQSGIPAAGAYDTTLAGVALNNPVTGALPIGNPVTTLQYLSRFQGRSQTAGTLILADRLWHNGGMSITSTASQSINSAAFPARDNAGTTNGDGVFVGVEVSANVGAGTPTLTLGYTNEAGSAGRTATNVLATVANPITGAFYPIGLQGADKGVRSVQTFQLSATWTSGTINLVAYRELASLELPANVPYSLDALALGAQRIYDNSALYLMFVPETTAATSVFGHIITSYA